VPPQTILGIAPSALMRRLHADHLPIPSCQMDCFLQHAAFLSRGGLRLPCPDSDVALSPDGWPEGAEYHHQLSFYVITKDAAASLQSHAHETSSTPHVDAMPDSGDSLPRLCTLRKRCPQGSIPSCLTGNAIASGVNPGDFPCWP
jgi:hypothetical protein